MVKKMTLKDFENMDKDELAIIDFSAKWCMPCQMMAPVFEEVSNEYEGKMNFYKVDTDEEMELAKKFAVMSIPALVVVKGGEKKDMSLGFIPAPSLKEFVEKNM